MKTLTPLLTLLVLFTLACDKDNGPEPVTEPPVDTVVWQAVPNLENFNVLNLKMIDNELIVISDRYLSRINEQTLSTENHYIGNFLESNMGAINDRFFTRVEKSWIFVFNTDDPEKMYGFDVKDHFPDFGKFFFPPTWMTNVMAVNNQDVFLTVFRPERDGITIAEPQLLLFRAEKDEQGNVSVHNLVRTSIDEGYVFGDLIGIHALQNDFIISLNPLTFKVTPDGNWTEVFEGRIFNFIEMEDKLLGFGDDDLLVSYDLGNSWQVLTSSMGGLSPWQLKGFRFEDGMVIWDTYRLAMLQIDDEGLQINSFCLNNIETGPGRLIQRMAIGQKNAYLGTKRGLYYKPLEDFWESVSVE
jgi:hypothetical protein